MFTIRQIDKDEIVNSHYVINYKDNLHAICKNDELVAYATFRIDSNIMWLDMIEAIKKGFGTEIINFFWEYYSLEKIKGLILCEEKAYRFWDKLGANIYYIAEEGYEIEELIDAGLESPFVLNR